MISWLVTWVVVACICVPGGPIPDEYGRIVPCAFATCNWRCFEDEHSRYFADEYEALRFVVNGEGEEDLKDFEIKPVYK